MHKPPLSQLDVFALCDARALLQSTATSCLRAIALPRLAERCLEDFVVSWSLQWGQVSSHHDVLQNTLELQAQTQLRLRCERCLQPMTHSVAVERAYLFVRDEATANRLDLDSPLDLLVQSTCFDALALIEDELLMALPYSPLHALDTQDQHVCTMPAAYADSNASHAGVQPNPFNALRDKF